MKKKQRRAYDWIRWTGLFSLVLLAYPFQFSGEIPKGGDRFLGADISFLPQLESRGMKFYEDGAAKDALVILKDQGFNAIRLRIFNNPSSDSGYSPKQGFCDLDHTLQMARRIKAAGMHFLLDFHYSDTWADPGKQFKPLAWKNFDFQGLQQAMHDFTRQVIAGLRDQGTAPDMVQIGNEINHGLLWPDGKFEHADTLAAFLRSAIAAVREVDPSIRIMLHIACGGQNEESRHFLDAMLDRRVSFDLIGESYYPRWHGTLGQLDSNLTDLASRYKQKIVVVEYSSRKKEVNDILFNLPGDQGVGTFIWEPLNTWERVFDNKGQMNDSLMRLYSGLARTYGISPR